MKHLVLFHHEPTRCDKELEHLYLNLMRQIKGKTSMTVSLAQEGKSIEV